MAGVQLSGNMTVDHKSFRIDDTTNGKLLVQIQFLDDGDLPTDMKQIMGQSVFNILTGRIPDEKIVEVLREEVDTLKNQLKDREAEILRIQTHETAAAHELDKSHDHNARANFKDTCDELAKYKAAIRAIGRVLAKVQPTDKMGFNGIIAEELNW